MITVCVDAMGGDSGPEQVLQGIRLALQKDPELQVLVVGAQAIVEPFCQETPRAEALISTQTISMSEHPATAVRTKRDSSIVRGCKAVKEGRAQGFFSAGSTGAIFASATLDIGRLKGVRRPALAYAVPGLSQHSCVFLDLGANADARPQTLLQFAHMGRAYAQAILHVSNPSVGLLSNGKESTKGSEVILAAHELLSHEGSWFVGNCEPMELFMGSVDVVVSDGFTGNVALKTIEATVKYLIKSLKNKAQQSFATKLGLLLIRPGLKEIIHTLSGDEQGGAVLLGLKAPVFVGHGSSSAKAVMNGTLACASAIRRSLVQKINEDLEQLL